MQNYISKIKIPCLAPRMALGVKNGKQTQLFRTEFGVLRIAKMNLKKQTQSVTTEDREKNEKQSQF